MKYIVIEADINDGDYLHRHSRATDELVSLVRKVSKVLTEETGVDIFTALNSYCDDNNPYQGLTTEEFQTFRELIPYDSQSGMPPHSIESIKLIEELEAIY